MNRCKQIYVLVFVLVVCCLQTKGQELSIGDTLPDYTFMNTVRNSSPSVRLSDFRGKLLILALWRTTCGNCVFEFAHLDSLQETFGNRVMILGVSTEPRELISRFFQSNRMAKQARLSTVTDDTVLAGKRFRFMFIPHMVVVDGAGVIKAITSPEAITENVVQTWLSGGVAKVPLKKEITDFDYEVPVYEEGKGRDIHQILYSSVISHGLPGVAPIAEAASSDTRYFYKAYNKTIPELYAQAFEFPIDERRVVLEVTDSSRFIRQATDEEPERDSDRVWVYNLILPKDYPSPNQFMLEDLNRFFGVHAAIEKRDVNCFVLIRTGPGERWKSKGGKAHLDTDGDVNYLQHISMYSVCGLLDRHSRVPVVNETGLENEPADMKLTTTPAHLPELRANLQQYDLDLIPAVRSMEVLVIKNA